MNWKTAREVFTPSRPLQLVHVADPLAVDEARLTEESRDADALVRRWRRELMEVTSHLNASIKSAAVKKVALDLVKRVRENSGE